MTIINCTPHDIVIRSADGDTTVPKGDTIARVVMVPGVAGVIEGIACPVYSADTVGAVEGIPEPSPGVIYMVSGMVGSAVAGTRSDCCVPGTGPADGAVRNEKGWIVAVTRIKMVRGGSERADGPY